MEFRIDGFDKALDANLYNVSGNELGFVASVKNFDESDFINLVKCIGNRVVIGEKYVGKLIYVESLARTYSKIESIWLVVSIEE